MPYSIFRKKVRCQTTRSNQTSGIVSEGNEENDNCNDDLCKRIGRNPQTGKEVKIAAIKKQIEIIKNKIEEILANKEGEDIILRKRPGRTKYSDVTLKKIQDNDRKSPFSTGEEKMTSGLDADLKKFAEELVN